MSAERLIRVHGQWCGWQSAEVPFDALMNVHWRQPPAAPHEFLHGFVNCHRFINGDIPHNCGGEAHTLLVCVLKHHAMPSLFAALCQEANSHREGGRSDYGILDARSARAGIDTPTGRVAGFE